jgi:hypothetical protein
MKPITTRGVGNMSGVKFIIVLAFAFVISVLLSLLGVHPYITYGIVLISFFVFFLLPQIWPVYFSTNLKEIEKFLLKNKKKPEYQLFYGAAYHDKKEVNEAIGKLLKNPIIRPAFPIYLTIQALMEKNIELAKEHIEKIKPGPYQNNYRSIIFIEENRFEEAKELIDTLPKPWMVEALKVELAKNQQNHEQAKEHALNAINLGKGAQKYVLAKTFERELGLKLMG